MNIYQTFEAKSNSSYLCSPGRLSVDLIFLCGLCYFSIFFCNKHILLSNKKTFKVDTGKYR